VAANCTQRPEAPNHRERRRGQSRLSGCSAKGAPGWLSRPRLFSTQLFVCGLLSLARLSSDLPTAFKECFSMTLKLTSQGTWTILSKMRGLKNASETSSPARLAAQTQITEIVPPLRRFHIVVGSILAVPRSLPLASTETGACRADCRAPSFRSCWSWSGCRPENRRSLPGKNPSAAGPA
jgi:hypothetical protein